MLVRKFKNQCASTVFFNKLFSSAITSDEKIFKTAEEIIEKRIRPVFVQDGSDITLEGVQNGTLIISIEQSCHSCSIRNPNVCKELLTIMQNQVPGVVSVREKLDFEDI